MTVEAAADPILRIDHVTKRFGGLVAVDDVTFDVKKGEIFALIGPNGAAKTTLFNGITGIFPPTAGRIVFQGREITGAKPHQVAAFGIARTFQNIRLFEYMSSLDNVRLGQHCRMHAKLWDSLFKTPAEHREEQRVTERAIELLQFVGIERYTHIYARNLPYGSQRRLEIARALATSPARRVAQHQHRRDRRAHRIERRREDDDSADDLGAQPRDDGQRGLRRARHLRRAGTRHRTRRHRPRPRGPAPLSADDRPRQPDDGHLRAQGSSWDPHEHRA